MPLMTKRYSNGDITVVWQPDICIHSGICARGLHAVFDPKRKPWIELQHADSATIAAQVAKGPSGAFSIEPRSAAPIQA